MQKMNKKGNKLLPIHLLHIVLKRRPDCVRKTLQGPGEWRIRKLNAQDRISRILEDDHSIVLRIMNNSNIRLGVFEDKNPR